MIDANNSFPASIVLQTIVQNILLTVNIGRLLRWPKWFIFLLRYEFSNPNSEFRIPNSEIPNSEFRISKKKVVYGNFVFGDATSGSVHGVGQGI